MANFNLNDYETVEQRLKRFWGDHPLGAVITDIYRVSDDHKNVIIKASIWFDKSDPMPAGVGYAQESQGGNGPNSNCWVENCDTSAVGRALANCTYSGDKRPSREEMAKANRGAQSDGHQNDSPRQGPPAQQNGGAPRLKCQDCQKALTSGQSTLSIRNTGGEFCLDHQKGKTNGR
ncbi:MAG: hypothetical protein ABIY70_24770 [Capsulimonas sp.]|uniref:hypothetical protein n=1 Tax=Capsulimonas sp. TaxID=2494211 RepID=UPI003263E8D4